MQGSYNHANTEWPLVWFEDRLENVEYALNLVYHRTGSSLTNIDDIYPDTIYYGLTHMERKAYWGKHLDPEATSLTSASSSGAKPIADSKTIPKQQPPTQGRGSHSRTGPTSAPSIDRPPNNYRSSSESNERTDANSKNPVAYGGRNYTRHSIDEGCLFSTAD
ncbi:hypothetical protein BG006_002303 [Podila minutissima]|uniref:Uncharacterized protein n=1 Tax=Podila minutissima TaxID=64525 RepID=A0A9P5SNA2_9FUNG|nr:hypothetical protein BG006_002303 [Podila minutissima]